MPDSDLAFVKKADNGWYVQVRVQPGAKKNEIAGSEAGVLRVRLTAPATENKANTALLEFIAAKLRLKKNKVTLVGGAKSREKRLFIPSGADPFWLGLSETI